MSNYKEELAARLLKFSVSIIKLAALLPRNAAGFAIANQIIRSACSVGANVQEAQDSISRKEFLHSVNISLKEARETLYWLKVIKESELIRGELLESAIVECNEIVSILVSTVKSLKAKSKVKL